MSMSLGAFNSSLQHEQGASNLEQPRHKERASIGDVQVSKQAGRTARHMGHLLEWSMLRAKQARQKVWPQGVVTGSNSSFKHKMQSVSSQLTTFLQHIAQALAQAVKGCTITLHPCARSRLQLDLPLLGGSSASAILGAFQTPQVPILYARVCKVMSLQKLPTHSEIQAHF